MLARIVLGWLAAVLALALGACSGQPAGPAAREPGTLPVVATTPIIAHLVEQVAGGRATVTCLLRPGTDPHDYEPSPAEVEAVARAGLVVRNGVGLDAWLDDLVESAGYQGMVVDASKGVPLRPGGGHAGGERDPHIWHNPRNVKVMVRNIAEGLAAADPEGAATYRERLDAYTAELDELDAEIERQLSALPDKRLVTNHDAFGYYVDRYGLEFVGSVVPSLETTAEPSARELSELVGKVKALGVRAVFAERTLPPAAVEALASEAGVKVVAGEDALYADTLGPPGSGADTYLGMMRHNTRTIVEHLGA